jgi:sec-independent protein translocase protein TatC
MNTLVYEGTTTALTAMNYLGFLFSTGFLLIISFQIPIIIIILSWLRIIDPNRIKYFRPYIHTGIGLLCAFITPTTDVISLGLIVIPAMLLTEAGFLIARLRFWG